MVLSFSSPEGDIVSRCAWREPPDSFPSLNYGWDILTISLVNDTAETIDSFMQWIDGPMMSLLRTNLCIRRNGGPWIPYCSPQRQASLTRGPVGDGHQGPLKPGSRVTRQNLVLYDSARAAFAFDERGTHSLFATYPSTPRDMAAGLHSEPVEVTVTDLPEAAMGAATMWREPEWALYLHDTGYDRERWRSQPAPGHSIPAGQRLGGLTRSDAHYGPLVREIRHPYEVVDGTDPPVDPRLEREVELPFAAPVSYEVVAAHLTSLSPVPLRVTAELADRTYDRRSGKIPLRQAMRRLSARFGKWVPDEFGYTLVLALSPL